MKKSFAPDLPPPEGPEKKAARSKTSQIEARAKPPRKPAAEPVEAPTKARAPRAATATPARAKKPASRPEKAPAAAGPKPKPWNVDVPEGRPARETLSCRIPGELFRKMHFVAQTTYGYTATRIVIEALEEKLGAMCKERGIE